jgi:DNA-binding transcriptional regulator YiaG
MRKAYEIMTPDQFRAALADLRYSQAAFARLAMVDARTVRRWCDGTRAVPGPVVALLGMMAIYKTALETEMLTDGGKPIDPQGLGVFLRPK